MKKLSVLSAWALVLFMALACSKEWLEDYKVDPTRPQDVTADVLLTSAQAYFAMASGDVVPRLTTIFLQQMTGTDRQSLAHNRYAQIGEADFDSPYGLAGYAGGMYDLKLVIDKTEGTSPHYAGVAKIMMAMYLGMFTDLFGDIPYSQAFQGEANLKPAFDSQQEIYNTIFGLLDEGIANCNEANSNDSPGSNDLIYGGDMALWVKLAHGMKARYLNHLSKKSTYSPTEVISEVNAALAAGEDALFPFGSSTNQANTWYQFTAVDRNGYMANFGTMYTMMEDANDPRVDVYRDAADSSLMGFWGGSATSPLPVLTHFELLYIKAEAEQRAGQNALNTLLEAIGANMDFLGVSASDRDAYLAGITTANLETIMNEKYVAMFTQAEAWTDWRRTDYPTLTVYPNANLSAIPRRMPYPQNEYLYNSSNVPMPLTASPSEKFGVDPTYRLWWDR